MKLTDYNSLFITGIYKITNTKNQHAYIGQSKNVAIRIKEHLISSFNQKRKDFNTPLHAAIRKYGIDSFDLDIIDVCSMAELNINEQKWIAKYNTFINGYNQTAGGKQSIRKIKLSYEQVQVIYMLLSENLLTNAEIASLFGISSTIVQRINTGRTWFDSTISYPIRIVDSTISCHFDGYAVGQYDKKSGELVRIFRSISSASKSFNGYDRTPGISKCCNGQLKTAYGFCWKKIIISKDAWLKIN